MSQENIVRIKAVYDALGDLAQEVIFIGGATVSLYADRPSGEMRPTDDVDILVELLNYKGYALLDEKLRAKGFVNDAESGVICRYIIRGIIVDVMPTAEEILGFSNKWYKEGFANSIVVKTDARYKIRIFRVEYFIATKLEAFKGRGAGDGRTSSDFEDVVYILNNRTTIWEELANALPGVRDYTKEEVKQLLGQKYLEEWISCHLEFWEQRRAHFLIANLVAFVKL